MTTLDPAETVAAVFRIESARIVAGVTRVVRDVGIAEELAQDALVAALERWPRSGVPDNPGAWLMATAKHRAIDLVRRKETYARKLAEVGRSLSDVAPPPEPDPDDIDDDVLRLMFTACHPVLSTQARIALTLRILGGLTTAEIARALFVSEATVAQRIVRAKRALGSANVGFEVPHGADREARLSSVLEVVYLIFNEGYSATSGADLVRPALCEDALRLARVSQSLMPDEPEVHGLAALLEFQGSRLSARVDADGTPVLLADQDRRTWDRSSIRRGMAALRRAGVGAYSLQAAIAACHARANRYEDTDWAMIASLYERLAAVSPSPVVELNRAVAVSLWRGPEAGLAIVDELAAVASFANYHLLASVRGDLLERLGRNAEAAEQFERAAGLTGNAAERELLRRRAATAREAGSHLRGIGGFSPVPPARSSARLKANATAKEKPMPRPTVPARREPTVWTRRLQLLTSVYSVVTTVGTALVLGYVTPEVLRLRTDASAAEIAEFLPGFRTVGLIFLVLNAIGIAALWNKNWIFWVALLTNLAQAIGFFTVDFDVTGMRGLGVVGTWVTDGGGGLLGLILLGFAVRYRGAWAYRRPGAIAN